MVGGSLGFSGGGRGRGERVGCGESQLSQKSRLCLALTTAAAVQWWFLNRTAPIERAHPVQRPLRTDDMPTADGRCGPLGILPLVQRCSAATPPQPARLSPQWVIAARVSDSAAAFAAAELQQNLSATHGLHLSVVDTASVAADRRNFIAVGELQTDPALATIVRAAGLNVTAATLAPIAPEGYHLTVRADAIFLLGSAQAGAFYAVQSLMQMADALGPSTLPAVAIQDWPDTPIRGAEIEVGPGPAEDWWHLVANTMARMKLNLLGPDSIAIPFGFDAESKQILMPDAKAVAGIKGLQSYFADRYIDIGTIAIPS